MGSLVVDFVGPILTSSEGNGYLLTCIDTFSRYAWAIPAADTTSHTAGDALIKIAMSLAGGTRGGAAHGAVGASAMFGSISGSTVASRLSAIAWR